MQLYLCEKPSQARDIAKVLGANRPGDGCLQGAGVTVTWCIGHLLETAPPDAYDPRYKRWVLADLPIVPIYTNIFAPPLPQPKRFVQLGRTIRELVESWPGNQRVANFTVQVLDLSLIHI